MAYNYNQAKLLTVFSTQYLMDDAREQSINKSSNLTNIVTNSSINGYVLIPRTHTGSYPETRRNYDITDMTSDDTDVIRSECIESMVEFALKIKWRKTSTPFWIGLPMISKNLFKDLTSHTDTAISYSKVMVKFIIEAKKQFSEKGLWDNVKGFYYNQERIYDYDFNSSQLLSQTNGEYILMMFTANYIHNSQFPYFTDLPTIGKDLIWIPYLPAYDPNEQVPVKFDSDDNPTMYVTGKTMIDKAYNNIGNITGKSPIFDCAFIQSNLIGIYAKEDVNSLSVTNYVNSCDNNNSSTMNRIRSGIRNINAIYSSIVANKLINYSDYTTPIVTNPTSNCLIGCEYELFGDKEHKLVEADRTELSLFTPYRIYDAYVESKPMAFYWQAGTSTVFNEVCREIGNIYNYDERINPKDFKLVSAKDSLIESLANTILKSRIETINAALCQPTSTSITLNFNNYVAASEAKTVAEMMKGVFLSDNPDKFWIRSMSYSINYSGDYANQISYNIVQKSNSDSNRVTVFNNNISSILNGLNVATNNNALSTMSVSNVDEDFVTFHKIYNWLITNVTYVESTDVYLNSAYGAIGYTNRRATKKGYAEALAVLCKAAGIPCLVIGGYKDGVTHYWNYVKINGKWWFVDIVLSLPSSTDTYKYKYFLREIPNSYMSSVYLPEVNVATGNYILYGDVDGNGEVTANDAAYAQQKVLLSTFDLGVKGDIAADVTGEGEITSNDVSHIMQKALVSTYKTPVEVKIANTYI